MSKGEGRLLLRLSYKSNASLENQGGIVRVVYREEIYTTGLSEPAGKVIHVPCMIRP